MANSKKKKNNAPRLTTESIQQMPTVYTFNLKDVPAEQYAKTLAVLFANPDFAEKVENRNALVKAADRMRPGSSEMLNLIRTIQQRDRSLADMLFSVIVQSNLHSEVTYDFLSFETLLKYYVDYSLEGTAERVDRLSCNLDRVTFLSDMLESVLIDVKEDMRQLFAGEVEFNQFDAVQQVLTQLRGFFKSSRSKDYNSPEAKLYMDYSDSINDYLYKRLKTYTDKYRKMHPAPARYTAEDMVAALNQYFDTDGTFDASAIKRTNTGGIYIDSLSVYPRLNDSQIEKIQKTIGKDKAAGKDTHDITTYNFHFTDIIMSIYKKKK